MTEEEKQPESVKPPRPQYGEMAPEGWVSPVTGEPTPAATASEAPAVTRPEAAAGTTATAQTAPENAGERSARLGVPHNLGVNKAAPAKSAAGLSAATQSAANQNVAPISNQSETPPAQAGATQIPRANKTTDRIATILLLAAGAMGALNLAEAFMNLDKTFAQIYDLYDLGTFNAPEWFGVLGTVGWISVLAVYALTLIISVQFMQRGRLAFWVPLAGATLSFILVTILMMIAVSSAPELIEYMQTNGLNLEKLQELQQ